MNIQRHIITVKNNRILIELPVELNDKRIEVILLPLDVDGKAEEPEIKQSRNKQLKDLFLVGEWSEEDIKPIKATANLFKKWDLPKF